MSSAMCYATLSFAKRKKTGALLVSPDNRPLSCGFNGTSPGADNNCESIVGCTCIEGWTLDMRKCKECNGTGRILKTLPTVHHAERNCLGYAAKNGISTKDCTLYITLSPCIECSKQIEVSGIVRVVYYEEYRDPSGITYLQERGITCEKINTFEEDSEEDSGEELGEEK